jgi:TrmH family RNA methyltransferase
VSVKRSEHGTRFTQDMGSKLLTLARDLQRRRGRERRALFVAEGVRAVEEVVRARLPIRGALVTPQLSESARGRTLRNSLESRGAELAEVSPRELATAADTETPQGVLAIAEVPQYSLETLRVPVQARLLVLDGVQDPGNVGTILRTAAALGAFAVVALPGTVDLWNPKVIRGAMGAHFQNPALQVEPDELFSFVQQQDVELWAAETRGDRLDGLAPPARLAIAVGNEGAGLSESVRAHARRTVALALEPGVESLNVAVATGILLYALRGKASPE